MADMMTQVATVVTDLGAGNRGSIGAADISEADRAAMIAEAGGAAYAVSPSKVIACIDMRLPAELLEKASGYADRQTAGGAAITETASDMMLAGEARLVSTLLAEHTRAFVTAGYEVIVHGDEKAGKAGCGANARLRDSLATNATNADVVLPKAWTLCQALGLDRQGVTEQLLAEMMRQGGLSAAQDDLWDVTPEAAADVIVANGGRYSGLTGAHTEKIIIVDVQPRAFDKIAFMRHYPRPDGAFNGAFVATLGAYYQALQAVTAQAGGSERDAARRMAGAVLFNIAVSKELTAEEQGNHETLPVVVRA